ncbi:MAG: hypothetical protein ABID71_07555 [Chloroflexota bacterium]
MIRKREHASEIIAIGKPDVIPIKLLLLDKENPRLASTAQGDSQEDFLRVLWEEMAVDEIAFSIAANGFYPEEALFVIPEVGGVKGTGETHYIVIEGNRRLAAVLLLTDPELRAKLKATDLPKINKEASKKLEILPVLIYPDRKSLWSYLGFRHINGTQPWDAFSKAKYVANVHEIFGIPLEEIADRIGDRHSTVIRFYRGIKILQQAEEQAGFSLEDRVRNKFYFSHLYTAVDQIEFQKFLGIQSDTSLKENPVPKSKLGSLSELMLWLYGKKSEGKEPLVQSQNPDLNHLRQAISKPTALSALRSGYPLIRAFEISIGDKRRFSDALTSAKEELQQAKATVTTGYGGDEDLFSVSSDIIRVAQSIKDEMTKIREESIRGKS